MWLDVAGSAAAAVHTRTHLLIHGLHGGRRRSAVGIELQVFNRPAIAAHALQVQIEAPLIHPWLQMGLHQAGLDRHARAC